MSLAQERAIQHLAYWLMYFKLLDKYILNITGGDSDRSVIAALQYCQPS